MNKLLITFSMLLSLVSCSSNRHNHGANSVRLWDIENEKEVFILGDTPELQAALREYGREKVTICQTKNETCFGVGINLYQSFFEFATTKGCEDIPVTDVVCREYIIRK